MSDDAWAAFDVPKVANPPGRSTRTADGWDAFDPPKQSFMGQLGHSIGMGARDVIEGAAALPGLAYDAAALPLNAGIAGYNAITGGKQPYIPSGQAQVGRLLDAVGMPKAETGGEKLRSGIIQGATGALAGAGAGGAAAAAPELGPVAQGIGRVLSSQPAMQAASGAAAGGVGEATGNPIAGLIAGAAVPGGAMVARRAISPFPSASTPGRAELVAGAGNEGIPLTAGQETGSRVLRKIETTLEQLPLTGGPQTAIMNDQREKFIEAAWKRAGINASDTAPETMVAARDKIGGVIGEIADRNTLKINPQFDQQLRDMLDGVKFLPGEIQGPMRERIKQIYLMQSQSPNGEIPGTSYRMLDSAMSNTMRTTSNGDLKNQVGQLRSIMRDGMDASISPADKDAWDTARRQYANYKVIEGAAGNAGAGAAEGQMSPVALRQALAKSVGKDGYALGRGDLNELSRIGQNLLRAEPDSGTAGLTQAHKWLTGGMTLGGAGVGATAGGPLGAVAGAAVPIVLPRMVQMLMNSPTGQAYLKNQLATDPVMTRNLAKALAVQNATQMGNQAFPNGGP